MTAPPVPSLDLSRAAREVVSLPRYPKLSDNEAGRVIEAVTVSVLARA